MSTVTAPPPPPVRLCVGVTGHRLNNAALSANQADVRAACTDLLARLDALTTAVIDARWRASRGAPRLYSMLADGADQFCADAAKALNWEIVAPLPFGLALSAATAAPADGEEAIALLAHAHARADGAPAALSQDAADRFFAYAERARIFALADRDALIEELYTRRARGDAQAAAAFDAEASHRYTLASRIVIEQSDVVLAIWDGASRTQFGGTGHTIATALENGVPVIWMRPEAPQAWRVLRSPEDLTAPLPAGAAEQDAALGEIVRAALAPLASQNTDDHGFPAFLQERWKPKSGRFWHGYRRIEAVFGGGGAPLKSLRQTYATPAEIADGPWRDFLGRIAALPGLPQDFVGDLKRKVAERFAWSDGISTYLSDAYRGGMILNFALSALAAIGGLTYMPFFSYDQKWQFALFELTLLCAIVFITVLGGRRRWHGRWFEMRRVAEYLRHNPILLAIGVARPAGRWPRGVETSWPEAYARQTLRDVGLPPVTVTQDYLRSALAQVLRPHIVAQRDYHVEKAKRLHHVHEGLDRLSTALFICAIVVVAGYLILNAAGAIAPNLDMLTSRSISQFTYFGVILPLLGATIAGVRYFGDFERFSAISQVAAEKLGAIAGRIDTLMAEGDAAIDYDAVARLAHNADDVVVSEIESWQAVFGGKHLTIPV
ncbi:MAG: hypothetical protein GC189_06205 [Alphaproteobacteria bacterium]|nr:hypothetical protein [Alphaproteobacteria bacterium]